MRTTGTNKTDHYEIAETKSNEDNLEATRTHKYFTFPSLSFVEQLTPPIFVCPSPSLAFYFCQKTTNPLRCGYCSSS